MFSSFIVQAAPIDWNSCSVDGIPTFSCLELVMQNILGISSAFIILVLFIMFIVGGFTYLTSFGSPDKVKKGQSTLKFAIIGFLIYVSAFLILKTIQFLFLEGSSFDLFNFNLSGGP